MNKRLGYGTVLPHAGVHGLTQRIERACADVAVDDADRTQGENDETGPPGTFPVLRGFVRSPPSDCTCVMMLLHALLHRSRSGDMRLLAQVYLRHSRSPDLQ